MAIDPDARITGTTAEFRFAADRAVAGFECSVGEGPWVPCTSPLTHRVDVSGTYVVRVRAIDPAGTRGPVAVSAWTVVRAGSSATTRIENAPPPAGAGIVQASPAMLSPFPLVRLAGIVSSRTVKVTVLSVRAPVRSRVTLTCRGRSCPVRRAARTIAAKGGRTAQTVRFDRLRNRRIAAGTVLEVRVTRAGRVGKYVKFTFVKGRAPKRSDRCLLPGSSRPSACPAS